MSATERDALRERIRKLMAMTTAAGCTEAEALAAAEKLRRLLDENGIDPANLDGLLVEEEPVDLGRSRRNQLDRLWPTIGWYCDCCVFTQRGDGPIKVVYAGLEPRPMIAHYLHDLCEGAAAYEVRRFKASAVYKKRRTVKTKRQAISAFLAGFAMGMASKLRGLKEATPEGGRLLALADAEIERRYKMSEARAIAPVTKRYDDARGVGVRAGLATDVRDGVGGKGRPVALIGHG